MDTANKIIYLSFFQLSGPLYSASIWMSTQIWYNSVMIECSRLLENM